MNIMHFSMPKIAYLSPFVYEPNLLNHIVYCFSHIFADQKFMGIFSMLFGASTLLYINSLKQKGYKRPVWVYFRKNFWLICIGTLHFTYIWGGDILILYGSLSYFLYFFKKVSNRTLLILGFIIYFIPSGTNYFIYNNVANEFEVEELNAIEKKWNPSEEQIQKELNLFRGKYLDQINYRESKYDSKPIKNLAIILKETMFAIDFLSRAFGMMLIGMAMFKMNILNNSKSPSFYKKMVFFGFGFGIPLSIVGLILTYQFQSNANYLEFISRIPNNIATPFIVFGYIGFIKLWVRTNVLNELQDYLSSIGKMALTCYLLESIIATFIFYGYGLGFFGHISRIGQLFITLFIWMILISFTIFWKRRFKYGPLEWIWRCLTNFKLFSISK